MTPHNVAKGVLRVRPCWARGVLVLWLGGVLGCTDLAGKAPLPSGVPDPESFRTAAGARAMYEGAVATFEYSTIGTDHQWGALLWAVLDGGLLGDELTVNTRGGSAFDYLVSRISNNYPEADYALDSRQLPEGEDSHRQAYIALQTFRARASQGIGALAAHAPRDSALRGHLLVLTGYAELLLADLFCSGVPLSTLDYDGDFTYRPGAPTDSVYAHALEEFDRASTLVAESDRLLYLARLGRGRALLALGRYTEAAQAVAAVPTDYRYDVLVDWSDGSGQSPSLVGKGVRGEFQPLPSTGPEFGFGASMADREGGQGPAYLTSRDPRTAGVFIRKNQFGDSLFFPAKYGSGVDVTPIAVASGIEARLIEAEAALQENNVSGMLARLNALRAGAGVAAIQLSAVPTRLAQEDTLFAERAAWLYLDGHRLGDLRRLLRQYNRTLPEVVPTETYVVPHPAYPQYGPYLELPIPDEERRINPYFTGCLSRGD